MCPTGRVWPCHFRGSSPLGKGFPVPPRQLAQALTLVQVAVGADGQVPALNPFSKGFHLLPQFPHLPASTVEPPAWAPMPDFGDSSTWDTLSHTDTCSGATVGWGLSLWCHRRAHPPPPPLGARKPVRFRRCESSSAVMVPGADSPQLAPVNPICGCWTPSSSSSGFAVGFPGVPCTLALPTGPLRPPPRCRRRAEVQDLAFQEQICN